MTIEEFKKTEIERLLKEGKTTREIGFSLGISRQAVFDWLTKNGYKSNSTWKKREEV